MMNQDTQALIDDRSLHEECGVFGVYSNIYGFGIPGVLRTFLPSTPWSRKTTASWYQRTVSSVPIATKASSTMFFQENVCSTLTVATSLSAMCATPPPAPTANAMPNPLSSITTKADAFGYTTAI